MDQSKEKKQQIPGYKLLSRLGTGGQANVYKAVQISMNRHVAVKVIMPEQGIAESELGRFMRRLKIPHLALHNSRDPAVPVFHQAIYAELVEKRGDEDLLVQRISDRYGHTENFSTNEVFGAFVEMVEWVDTGVAPMP